ncbi:hypothetical protein [Variovorax ginsengisoli]|uniref:Uncharacterized protein n=1 Tax=Variovorax ginsengisoli TaxID=363844 RepID=A0ABT8SIG6_9BURK|nr:hypothetical protein [Variovorax ginsengisoli]MDN8618958.1 hypothetical protein [Variovorax ginsengisoli]MDO1538128.1 hypothetical protein [Variovorax ginsengisoli]
MGVRANGYRDHNRLGVGVAPATSIGETDLDTMLEIRTVVLFIVAMLAVQMVVVMAITAMNSHVLSKFKGYEYPRAIAELAKTKPLAAGAIRLCYALALLELAVMLVWSQFAT